VRGEQMKEKNRKQIREWLENADAIQWLLVDVGSRIQALELAIDNRIVKSDDREALSTLPKALASALEYIKNVPLLEDKECKEILELWKGVIKGQMKALKVLSARKEDLKEEEQIIYGIDDEEAIRELELTVLEKHLGTPSEVAAFWDDTLSESRRIIMSLMIKYNCFVGIWKAYKLD